MEHNLEDTLNLESSIEVDFGHSEDAVVSEDITLDSSSHVESIPMEFEHIEEQPMLMDTGSEEIIDFIGEQFILQDYPGDQQHETGAMSTIDSNEQNILTSQSDTMIDIQFEPQTTASKPIMQEVAQPKMMTVKSAPSKQAMKKSELVALAPMPRQIAIAPKPPKLLQTQKAFQLQGKQYAIAPKSVSIEVPPKPVALVANRAMMKKVYMVPSSAQTKTVLAHLGKQMVSSGSQKIKLVTASGNMPVQYIRADQNQLIAPKNVTGSPTKQVVTKFVMQKSSNVDGSNQPAVLTKILPTTTSTPTRFVTMHQKTVPISFGNKVLMASPSEQGVKFTKKHAQIIAINSPQKLMPSQPQGTTTKKVVITPKPSQNVILRTTAPPKTLQVTKDGNIVNVHGQKSQLHQINVPGKGIQYIRLITNTSTPKPTPKPQPAVTAPTKTFVLTDDKGNLIQMTAEKISCADQPPPLVLTANTSAHSKVMAKPLQKLVRIAPISNSTQLMPQPTIRSSQSLLAPLSPMEDTTFTDDVASLLNTHSDSTQDMPDIGGEEETEDNEECSSEPMESKASLQTLIAETVAGENIEVGEVEVEFERDENQEPDEPPNIMDNHDIKSEHPLIVIPSGYNNSSDSFMAESIKHESLYPQEDSNRRDSLLDTDGVNQYATPDSPRALSETGEQDLITSDLGLRPRKACNCTKSQCLKLYCDCFANGEFCNSCNCNNCHNNLENEELRQKAIRGCLDRNPNAFRPKIGKSKSGGADLIRRHNKGCNCKRSGCLKNYCECFEAKIACSSICKCVGCRNVEETLERGRRREVVPPDPMYRHPPPSTLKQPCNFMTSEVIEAVCQCLVAAASEEGAAPPDPVRDVLDEFARCLQEIIGTAHHTPHSTALRDEV